MAGAGGSELRLLTQIPRVRSLRPDERFSLTQFDDFQTTRADIRTEPFQHRQTQELFRKPVIKSECLRLSHPHVTCLDGGRLPDGGSAKGATEAQQSAAGFTCGPLDEGWCSGWSRFCSLC